MTAQSARIWLVDTNILPYLLTREDQLAKASHRDARAERHLRTLYAALDSFVEERLRAGERFVVTPLVVYETLNVLQYAEAFSLDGRQAAEVLLTLVQLPQLACEDRECLVAALELQATGAGKFVDGYLACRAQEDGVWLLTNDGELHRMVRGKAKLLRAELPE